MSETPGTNIEAFEIAGRDHQGPRAVVVLCGRHEPAQEIGSVRDDPRLGFVLRTGAARTNRQTYTAIIGDDPKAVQRFVYPCPVCGDLRPDPALLTAKLEAYRTTGKRQKLSLA